MIKQRKSTGVAAAAAKKAETTGTKPAYFLKVRQPGSDEFVTITGLWENQDKNGNGFLSGSVKDGDNAGQYFIMKNSFVDAD